MVDIVHRVGIKAPVSAVYAALASVEGVAGWWTRETTGSSHPGGRMTMRFRDPAGREVGAFGIDVLTLVPNEAVRWRVQEGPPEWVGTGIEFLLSTEGEHCIVRFAHRGWREEVEFMAHCSMKWAVFLMSLRDLVETGKGKPSPDDVKIDNWN